MGDRNTEILTKLDQLLTVTTGLQAEVTGQGQRIDRLERTVSDLAHAVDKGMGVVNVRLDEQRQTINALIPTRVAAVPGRADAAD